MANRLVMLSQELLLMITDNLDNQSRLNLTLTCTEMRDRIGTVSLWKHPKFTDFKQFENFHNGLFAPNGFLRPGAVRLMDIVPSIFEYYWKDEQFWSSPNLELATLGYLANGLDTMYSFNKRVYNPWVFDHLPLLNHLRVESPAYGVTPRHVPEQDVRLRAEILKGKLADYLNPGLNPSLCNNLISLTLYLDDLFYGRSHWWFSRFAAVLTLPVLETLELGRAEIDDPESREIDPIDELSDGSHRDKSLKNEGAGFAWVGCGRGINRIRNLRLVNCIFSRETLAALVATPSSLATLYIDHRHLDPKINPPSIALDILEAIQTQSESLRSLDLRFEEPDGLFFGTQIEARQEVYREGLRSFSELTKLTLRSPSDIFGTILHSESAPPKLQHLVIYTANRHFLPGMGYRPRDTPPLGYVYTVPHPSTIQRHLPNLTNFDIKIHYNSQSDTPHEVSRLEGYDVRDWWRCGWSRQRRLHTFYMGRSLRSIGVHLRIFETPALPDISIGLEGDPTPPDNIFYTCRPSFHLDKWLPDAEWDAHQANQGYNTAIDIPGELTYYDDPGQPEGGPNEVDEMAEIAAEMTYANLTEHWYDANNNTAISTGGPSRLAIIAAKAIADAAKTLPSTPDAIRAGRDFDPSPLLSSVSSSARQPGGEVDSSSAPSGPLGGTPGNIPGATAGPFTNTGDANADSIIGGNPSWWTTESSGSSSSGNTRSDPNSPLYIRSGHFPGGSGTGTISGYNPSWWTADSSGSSVSSGRRSWTLSPPHNTSHGPSSGRAATRTVNTDIVADWKSDWWTTCSSGGSSAGSSSSPANPSGDSVDNGAATKTRKTGHSDSGNPDWWTSASSAGESSPGSPPGGISGGS